MSSENLFSSNSSSSNRSRNVERTQRKRSPPAASSAWSPVGTATLAAATVLVSYGAYQAVQWLYQRPNHHPPHQYINEEAWDASSTRENGENSARNKADTNDQPEHSAHGNNTHTSMHKQQHAHRKAMLSSLSKSQLLQRQEMVRVAFTALLPLLRRRLQTCTNVAAERQKLKQLRQGSSYTVHFVETSDPVIGASTNVNGSTPLQQQQQQEGLWMKIQVESLTRWLTTVYAYALLSTLLTIQISIGLRPQRGEPVVVPSASTTSRTTPHIHPGPNASSTHTISMVSCHEALETTLVFFWEHGFPVLVARVRQAVTTAVRDWHAFPTTPADISATTTGTTADTNATAVSSSSSSVTYCGTLEQFMEAMQHCTTHVDLSPFELLTACFIPPTESSLPHDSATNNAFSLADHSSTTRSTDNLDDPLMQLPETWDLLESPVATDAVRQSLDAMLAYQRVHDWQPLFASAIESCDSAPIRHNCEDNRQPLPPPLIPWPLVIAHTKPLVSAMLLDQDGAAVSSLIAILQSQVPALHDAARISAAAEW
jgi:hypothetical protein